MITRSAGMWAAFVLCAAALHAQFADFSNHDTSHKFGTWNLSDDDVPDAEYWSSQAESENFLITVYAHVVIGDNYNIALGDLTPDTTDPDLTISYHMVVLNKITGQKTGPTALDGGNAAYVHLNATLGNPYNVTVEGIIDEASALVALEGFRPAVAFTPRAADPGNPNSAIVAFPQRDATSGAIDIVTIFLVYNSTTDTFTESTTRQKVNVSNSSGNSLHPGLIILDDSIGRGDFVVCWTDDSTAGTIGGSADLPVDNFGFGLTDVYARRYQQEFPSVPGAGATPDDIAVNVSDSDDVDESWVRMTTDHDDRAWVAFVSDGEAGGTNVAGTGAGPTSGTTDVFVCGLDVSATLSRDSARNVSQSAGSSLRPDICYNYDSTADDDVIGLIFLDDSDNGIGGNNSISTRTSLPNPTNPPNAGSKALDTYVRSFTLTGTILSGNQFICDNITYDTDDQRIVHMTPGNGLGFFLGWTTNHYNSTTTEWDSYASYLLEVDEDGDDVGTVLSIPVNTTTTPFELVYDMTVGSDGASLTSVGLSFISTSSSQENLRPGEPNVGGGWDVYAIEGELGGSGTPATVAVSGIKANNGAPIDPFNAPGTIDVVYKVTNTDAVALLTVTGSTITAPLGFTLFGSISPDPSGGILI
ncbi:MAG: hypothetical protein L6Q71_10090, partial [Planctomycetes bacterium]|nr:hypothetical protein [Planctomycetota bacterium]